VIVAACECREQMQGLGLGALIRHFHVHTKGCHFISWHCESAAVAVLLKRWRAAEVGNCNCNPTTCASVSAFVCHMQHQSRAGSDCCNLGMELNCMRRLVHFTAAHSLQITAELERHTSVLCAYCRLLVSFMRELECAEH
jgi:hypothetical protein